MIQVIPCDDHRVLDAILFPEQNPMNYHYINQQLQNLSQNLNDAGRQFMLHHTQIYAQIDHSEIARKARQAYRGVQNMYQSDVIQPLETMEQLQMAQLTMQRWLMTSITARQLRMENRIDGYSDTYLDIEPGRIGEQHTDWRRVNSGNVVETDTGFVAVQYFDEEWGGEPGLAQDQQRAIQKSIRAMERHLAEGKDVTNIFGGDVGI